MFGLLFGMLCAPVYAVTGGWAFAVSWWISGIPTIWPLCGEFCPGAGAVRASAGVWRTDCTAGSGGDDLFRRFEPAAERGYNGKALPPGRRAEPGMRHSLSPSAKPLRRFFTAGLSLIPAQRTVEAVGDCALEEAVEWP